MLSRSEQLLEYSVDNEWDWDISYFVDEVAPA